MSKGSLYFFVLCLAILPNVAHSADAQDAVLLSSSGVAVTRADFDAEITRIPADKRVEFLASRERIGRILQEILIQKAFAAQARAAGLDNDPAIRKKAELAVDRVLAAEMKAHLKRTANVPDMELRAREIYIAESEQFFEEKTVCGAHILTDTQSRSRDAALARAREIAERVRGGADFGSIAVELSDDKSVQENKGDLGCFTSDKMVKAFSDAVFAMRAGEISEPVETKFGFHIIKVSDVIERRKKPFDSVKAGIVEKLTADYEDNRVIQAMEAITKDKTVAINEEEIQKIKTKLNFETLKNP